MARRSPRSPRARLFSAVLALRDSCARRYRACRGDVVRFGPIATTFTDYVPSDDCRPGISATVTGTDAVVGQIVQTPPPSSGSIFRGQDTTTLTVQFSDGSYGIGAASFRFVGPEIFVAPPSQATRVSVVTFPYVESLTIYDVSGQVIGTETSRSIEHYIIEDLPPLGPSDNDVVRMSFDRGRLICNV